MGQINQIVIEEDTNKCLKKLVKGKRGIFKNHVSEIVLRKFLNMKLTDVETKIYDELKLEIERGTNGH